MSLDDLPRSSPSPESESPVRRVDRPSSQLAKITRAEELRLQLADEIVRGALAPGSPLDETDIANRFSVSDRLSGMFEAMAELEAICAGLAAERMSAAERHGLEAIHEELRVLSYTGNPERFHEVNERFHNAIYAGSQNGYIAEMTLATRVRVQPFRRAQFRNLGRLAKSHAEHDRVVVAIMRGDKTGAPAATRAHI